MGCTVSWAGTRHVLTDSGGYQVFSLEPDVDDDGATFRSVYDGSRHRLTPERAVDVQLDLGSDIQMVLDVCPPLPSPPADLRLAVDRTAAWAERARTRFLAAGEAAAARAQFGIVQGRHRPRPAGRERRADPRRRLRRLRDRGALGRRGPCRDGAGACRGHRAPAGRPAAVLHGPGRRGRHRRGCRGRRRPVRLCAADPPRPPRHAAHRRRQGQHPPRRVRPRRRPGRSDVAREPGEPLVAGVSAPSLPGRRADRRPSGDPPQRRLAAALHGAAARRDRRGPLRSVRADVYEVWGDG